jgi:hypothetical protein
MDLPKALRIDHVVDRVYISGWRATLHADYLRRAGITHVLKLYPGIPHFPDDFTVLEHPIDETMPLPTDIVRCGAEFVVQHVDAGQAVLVMCWRGVNRSASFVLAYLLERGTDPRAAFALLRERHFEATPHPDMWQSLIDTYGLACTVEDALIWMRRE